jgi:uncharacterized protein YgbK (DUF1537 family)
MHDSNLVRVLARQTKAPVGLIALPVVVDGGAAILQRLAELAREGCGSAIIDAVFQSDLEAIGEAAAQSAVSVGASGLGLGLARALAKGRPAGMGAPLAPVGGRAAILAGSCSRATLDQITAVEGAMPTLRLSAQALIENRQEAAQAVAWAKKRLAEAPVLIAVSAEPQDVVALQARFGREMSGRAIEAAMAAIAQGLVAAGVRRLIVAGGETSGAVVDRLGVTAFRLGPEIAAGVPLMRTIGREGGDMQMALKSGNFGGRDFFMRALSITR